MLIFINKPQKNLKGNKMTSTKKAFNGGISKTLSKSTTGSKGNFKPQSPRDQLLQVLKVIPSENAAKNTGYMICKRENKDEEIIVRVNEMKFQKIEENRKNKPQKVDASNAGKYQGHKIDIKFKEYIEPKGDESHFVIVNNFKYVAKEKENDVERSIYECDYINNVTERDKVIVGLVTANGFYSRDIEQYRLTNVQHWIPTEENDMVVKAFGFDEEEKWAKIGEEMDAAYKENEEKKLNNKINQVHVAIGFKFRTIAKNKNHDTSVDASKKYIVIDTSTPFDYDKDKKQLLNVENLKELMASYKDYIESQEFLDEDGNPYEDIYPEVSFYKNYWVSQSSTLTFPIQGREFLPIFKLTRTRTGMSVNDSDSVLQGKNWGANNAYIVLGNNKLEKVNNVPTEIVRNFVNKLYAQTFMGNIDAFIKTHFPIEDGDELDRNNSCEIALPLRRIADDEKAKVINEMTEHEQENFLNNSDDSDNMHESELNVDEVKAVEVEPQIQDLEDDIPF